jgi:spore coat protein U-like protein
MRAGVIVTSIRVVLVAAALLLCARTASADGCTVGASPIVFGSYDVFNPSPLDSTGSITYQCTGGAKKPIGIYLVAASGTSAPALMRGAERLSYNLFQNAGRSVVWGIGSGGSQPYIAERGKDPVTLPVFGRIPPGQDVSVGRYADTVTVVINF